MKKIKVLDYTVYLYIWTYKKVKKIYDKLERLDSYLDAKDDIWIHSSWNRTSVCFINIDKCKEYNEEIKKVMFHELLHAIANICMYYQAREIYNNEFFSEIWSKVLFEWLNYFNSITK